MLKTFFVLGLLLVSSTTVLAGVRVDLSQDNGRGDVVAPGWDQWRVVEGERASATFGEVTVTLRAPGGRLSTQWWKPGFDYPARMASDGVVVAGPLELVLSGLPAGKHSLGLYHNHLSDTKPTAITIRGPGSEVTVTPTKQVKHDAETATAFLEFIAAAGKDVVITFTPEASGSVVLNGFEIDRSDLTRRARQPSPSDGDEHVALDLPLTWRAPQNATAFHVYLGTDPAAVARATRDTAEFRGETREPTFPTATLKLNHQRPYYWRVDSVVDNNKVISGEIWSFRIRHLSFPEAEGYGRFAIGGRGGKVLEVTNLNDEGPGSLRAAIEASGPRTVVFRTGGVIRLKSKLIVQHPYLTVAGQTAPGDGICLTNYTFGCSGTHDVIIRHMRIRPGDESGLTQDGSGARGCDHLIFDHCSISWSIDEGFSSREAGNLTVQRCLIAEALNIANHKKYEAGKGHSFAGSISGNIGSFHHNLLAHCTGRNWSLAGGLDRTGQRLGGRLDIRNNVVYNWRNRTTDGGVLALNFVNNYYLPGPATETFTLLKPDPSDADRGMRAYLTGNVIIDKPQFDADNWQGFVGPAEALAKVKSPEPLFEPHVTTHSAVAAFDNVLADVGARRPRLDPIDTHILQDVRRRTHTHTGSKGHLPGIIDTPKDAGGLPDYAAGEAPVDSDHDGMPDDWERAHSLDPNNAADAGKYRADGYTELEGFLNELGR